MRRFRRSFPSLLGFLAAVLFFGCATFEVTLGDVPLVEAGLLSLAIGLVFDTLDF